jgi:hypothetical protein
MICSQSRSSLVDNGALLACTLLLAGCLDRQLKPLNPCLVSGVVEEVAISNIDKVDMLFMVDNSDSMQDKQAALRAQFPHLIEVMTTGKRDNDPTHDFPPAKDLHLGVVTSDMGLPGVSDVAGCKGTGLDGLLQHQPSAQGQGCQTSYEPFLSFKAGVNDPIQTAKDFACVALVGTGGCGYEQQLESSLKALWPSIDPMPDPVTGNRIKFLADPLTGLGELGHGDVESAGFLRNDPTGGLSLIAVIALTDEDDCSIADTRPFAQNLPPDDPAAKQPPNLRCFYNKQALYPVERYVQGLKALRPGNEKLVIFAAITGVPQQLVSPEVLAKVKLSDPAQAKGFYKSILDDPNMVERIDSLGTPDPSDDRLAHSCQSAVGKADPPRRLVQVAEQFGENGIVQSICQDDYEPALDAIIAVIAHRLGNVCLPRSLVRNSKGLVGCNVVWELPPPGTQTNAPTACGAPGFEYLLPPDPGSATVSKRGGAVCRVAQLAVQDDPSKPGSKTAMATLTDGTSYADGWYYDDFSVELKQSCSNGKQRVAFTNNAKPPTGVTVKLECLNQTQSLANDRTDLAPGLVQPSIGSPCESVMRNGQTLKKDAACEVRLATPTKQWPDGIDRSMFCHPQQNVCALACSSNADCPPAWVCDDKRPETLMSSVRPGHENGTPICVNPTCGDPQ